MRKHISILALLLAAMMLASCTPAAVLGLPFFGLLESPEETIPEETTPDVTTPEETIPDVTTPEATTPEETTPEETTPEQTTPEQTTPEETTPEVTTPEETTPEDVEPEVPAPMPKKILAIGNSFSVDAMEHLWEILIGEGYTDFVLGNLYIGGCTLDGHKARIDSAAADYTFYTNTGTGWKNTKASIQTGLSYTDWDVITIQQASGSSGMLDTFGNLDYIINYVRSTVNNPDLKIYWHMTWAYQGNSNHAEFYKYNSNQYDMYNAILNAVDEKVKTNEGIDGILPCGTAIQNIRTSYLGDTLTRDGYHLSYDIGRYTAALVWYKVLWGADLTDVTAVPTPYPDVARHLPAIKEAVQNAAKNPFEITAATVTGPTEAEALNPFAQMTEADIAYLESRGLNANDYVRCVKDILCIFAPETLPVGSIVHVVEGYKYRLEGWQSLTAKNKLARLDNSTKDIVIEQSLYTKYNYIAFNISFASGGGTVMFDDGWGFRIYVPKTN